METAWTSHNISFRTRIGAIRGPNPGPIMPPFHHSKRQFFICLFHLSFVGYCGSMAKLSPLYFPPPVSSPPLPFTPHLVALSARFQNAPLASLVGRSFQSTCRAWSVSLSLFHSWRLVFVFVMLCFPCQWIVFVLLFSLIVCNFLWFIMPPVTTSDKSRIGELFCKNLIYT